ncbi:hypothetical protein MLD38_037836 [Melastoma candidum]|uniref:Uncharacterized protein n=1 Tax=Melastoma candidum TaxID=119954 RepID=A0ACB9LNI0_9MYRT|nr:hypothetical protein MLD38_037836 [Melastoma candidum]
MVCLSVYCLGLTDAEADTTEKYHWCNQEMLTAGTSAFYDMVEIRDYTVHKTYEFGFNSNVTYQGFFAQASCHTPMSPEDCVRCLGYADDKLYELCNFAVGGQITQADCRLRYELYNFDNNW